VNSEFGIVKSQKVKNGANEANGSDPVGFRKLILAIALNIFYDTLAEGKIKLKV
jgi:hypothetical protein